MKKSDLARLTAEAEALQGRRQSRYISAPELAEFARLDRKRSLAGKTIRVYSFDGFVANAYKWRCPIDYLYRDFDPETGKPIYGVAQTSAQRPHSNGALIVVNRKARERGE